MIWALDWCAAAVVREAVDALRLAIRDGLGGNDACALVEALLTSLVTVTPFRSVGDLAGYIDVGSYAFGNASHPHARDPSFRGSSRDCMYLNDDGRFVSPPSQDASPIAPRWRLVHEVIRLAIDSSRDDIAPFGAVDV